MFAWIYFELEAQTSTFPESSLCIRVENVIMCSFSRWHNECIKCTTLCIKCTTLCTQVYYFMHSTAVNMLSPCVLHSFSSCPSLFLLHDTLTMHVIDRKLPCSNILWLPAINYLLCLPLNIYTFFHWQELISSWQQDRSYESSHVIAIMW